MLRQSDKREVTLMLKNQFALHRANLTLPLRRKKKSQIFPSKVSRGEGLSQSAGLCVHTDPDGHGVQTSSPPTTTTTDPLAELDSQHYRWEGGGGVWGEWGVGGCETLTSAEP